MANKVEDVCFCLVMSGEWVVSVCGEWNFVVDKDKLSRNVPLNGNMSLIDVQTAVGTEFGVSGGSVALSYWLRNSYEFVTGTKTPPVLVTTDVGIKYFMDLLEKNSGMNLFVKFGALPTKVRVRDEVQPFSQASKKVVLEKEHLWSQGSKSSPVLLEEDEELVAQVQKEEAKLGSVDHNRGPIVREVNPTLSSVGSRDSEVKKNFGNTESSDFLDSQDVPFSMNGFEDPEWDIDLDTELSEVDEEPLPRGYDTEFWAPFLDEEMGGSNAVEVMCSTNDAFDHRVVLNGGENIKSEGKRSGTEESNPHIPTDTSTWTNGTDSQIPVDTSTWTNGTTTGGGSTSAATRRNLEEVDDEEFDIPPLFDDTVYENDDIPDLDLEEENGIYKGKLFASKVDCQIALAIYAIKNQFHFKQPKTRRDLFVVTCSDDACHWRVLARERRENGYYEIRKTDLQHTCSIETRSKWLKKATSRVIASVYKSKYGSHTNGPNTTELQQLVLEDLRAPVSNHKCRRAKDQAVEQVVGTDEEAYLNLASYLYSLQAANPGTITDIKTEMEENGEERFLYMFLAFGPSIQGMKNLRRVLVVDGTHLYGKYKGVLLTASGQDANFQVFPLAFAVVDSENDESWTWFFERVERIIADSGDLTIISDRQQSIYKAKSIVYPHAHHAACIVHLARNVVSRFKNKGLANLVKDAAYCWTTGMFKDIFSKIKMKSPDCARYLERIGMAHWTRLYFKGMRYNLMTSNIAESLNKALRGGRSSHIIELIKFIRAMMTRWFNARRTKSGKHGGQISPEVEKEMTKRRKAVDGSRISSVSSWSVEVVGKFSGKYHVLLKDKKCNCRQFDKVQIPCGHAMLAADNVGLCYTTLVGNWYKTSTWSATYSGVINPEEDAKDVEIPDEILTRVLLPPHTKRPSGRPRELRIPSTGELESTTKSRVNRCSRCKNSGHNRARCSQAI